MSKYITIICLTVLVILQMYLTGKWTMMMLFPAYGVWKVIKAAFTYDKMDS